jgi:hypothetical protein
MPADKVSGPVGFTSLFYKIAWLIIRDDIMHTFSAFWSLDFRSFYLVNHAYIILLQKKQDAQGIKDYQPISLIHSFSKLISKVLSIQLGLRMHELICQNQSAFIRGLALHDNFMVVQATSKFLHARSRPSILLKLDIAKAFDIVG